MRRAIIWGLALILALGAFYVGWPAWTGRQIAKAIEADDAAALDAKVDFERVRARARPFVEAEMARSAEKLKGQGGLGAAIAGQLQRNLGPQIADAAVRALLTPASLIQMVRQGKDFRRALQQVTTEKRAGGAGGVGSGRRSEESGAAGGEATGPATKGRGFGLGNIKGYRLTGPLGLAIGLARDPAASEPEVTIEMAFTGGDWKVVGLVPRL